jgi:lipopolysaccharide export system protein LptA
VKLQQYSIIFFFLLGCIALSTLSTLGRFNDYGGDINKNIAGPKYDEVDESYLKNSEYYYLDHGKPLLKVDSDELTISTTNSKIFGFNPIGVFYNDKTPLFFQSKNFLLYLKKQELILENNVDVNFNNTTFLANKIILFSNGRKIEAQGNIHTTSLTEVDGGKILINSDLASGDLQNKNFEYKGQVTGKIQRKKLYEENIQFQTDFLSYTALQNLVELKGNVLIIRENSKAYSLSGQIFLENYNKKLKYYALYDDVKLEEHVVSNGNKLERKAFAEKLEGIVSEKKIILTGFPKVFQQKDVIKGNRITIRENVETVEVDDANSSIILKAEDGG